MHVVNKDKNDVWIFTITRIFQVEAWNKNDYFKLFPNYALKKSLIIECKKKKILNHKYLFLVIF